MDIKDSISMAEESESPPPYTIYANEAAKTSKSAHQQQQGGDDGGIESSGVDRTYPESSVTAATSHLQHHLASLPTRMRRAREARSLQQSFDDASLLDALVPEIEDFLAYLGGLAATPKLAHLTLVPEGAVPARAVLSGMEELRRRGELCRVARVNVCYPWGSEKRGKSSTGDEKKKEGKDGEGQTWTTGREFSDWGRFGESSSSNSFFSPEADADPASQGMLLWWQDEDMARRLARHLQPKEQEQPPVLDTPVQTIVEERLPSQKEKKKGSWFWGRSSSSSSSKGGNTTSTSTYATKTVEKDVRAVLPDGTKHLNQKQNQTKKQQGGAAATMTVTAEEVAFRTENDFGIMESRRGWAVVVVVQVRT